MTQNLAQAFNSATPLVSAMMSPVTAKILDEAGIGVAVTLTLTGMALHWHLPRHRMSMEERMKDGKLTEEQAQRQLRFYGWCAPIATLLGVLVLVAVLFNLSQ
jgi:hypothetical protein